jgi:hypothetical protein
MPTLGGAGDGGIVGGEVAGGVSLGAMDGTGVADAAVNRRGAGAVFCTAAIGCCAPRKLWNIAPMAVMQETTTIKRQALRAALDPSS